MDHAARGNFAACGICQNQDSQDLRIFRKESDEGMSLETRKICCGEVSRSRKIHGLYWPEDFADRKGLGFPLRSARRGKAVAASIRPCGCENDRDCESIESAINEIQIRKALAGLGKQA